MRYSEQSAMDRQTCNYREHPLVTGHTGGTTTHPTSRSAGIGKDREGRATAIKGGRHIVTYHSSLRRAGQPREGHGSGNVGRGRPTAPAIRRGRVADVELTGGTVTTGNGIVVESEHQVSGTPGCGFIDSQPWNEVINPAADRIGGDACH